MHLTIASLNCHVGIDGWGRPFDVLASIRAFDADVVALQEVFIPDTGDSFAVTAAAQLGYQIIEVPLAPARILDPEIDGLSERDLARWGPGRSGGGAPRSLQFDHGKHAQRSAKIPGFTTRTAQRGAIGIALLSRLPIENDHVLDLPTSPREIVPRKVIIGEIGSGDDRLVVAALHLSHLAKGSPRQLSALRHVLLGTGLPSVIMADMNCWGPLVIAMLRRWKRSVRGRTWPAWQPHSQVDHIVISRSMVAIAGEVARPSGSDHRGVWATIATTT